MCVCMRKYCIDASEGLIWPPKPLLLLLIMLIMLAPGDQPIGPCCARHCTNRVADSPYPEALTISIDQTDPGWWKGTGTAAALSIGW